MTEGSVVAAMSPVGVSKLPLLISQVILTPEVSSGIVAVCVIPELREYTCLTPEYSNRSLASSE